jgi:hypothetical protein
MDLTFKTQAAVSRALTLEGVSVLQCTRSLCLHNFANMLPGRDNNPILFRFLLKNSIAFV